MPHHAPGERVARARRVDHLSAGYAGRGADAVAVDEQAVLALLHHDELRPHLRICRAAATGFLLPVRSSASS